MGDTASGIDAYTTLGLLLLVGVVVFFVAMMANRLLRTTKPSAAKATTYECGLDPVGGDWAQAQIRYYVYAYLYVLFAVEAVFLFPWAVTFRRLGPFVFWEMMLFLVMLLFGLAYAWRKGVLQWE